MNAQNHSPSPGLFTHSLGYPRIGARRELKKAVEAYWKGKSDATTLDATASSLRRAHWQLQKEAGIRLIPSNDFSLYDQVLDMSCLLGNVPKRFAWNQDKDVDLDTYFAIARGSRPAHSDTCCAPKVNEGAFASEMTKWFDTNYHFIVPEFNEQTKFKIASRKPFAEFAEALSLGIRTKPVLLGPVSYLLLGKVQAATAGNFDRFSLLSDLIPVYGEILKQLSDQGADWVQLDEPIFALDLNAEIKGYLHGAYSALARAAPKIKLLIATYFGTIGQNLMSLLSLPVQGYHLDLTRGAPDLDMVLSLLKRDVVLSLGVVDGRNVWRNHYDNTLNTVKRVLEKIEPDRLWLAPSCSLLHVPNSLQWETRLSPTIKSWMAYAQEKLHEVSTLARLAQSEDIDQDSALIENRAIHASRASSPLLHREEMRQRLMAINTEENLQRGPFEIRQQAQRQRLKLPSFPTTTIGSFPQTEEVRSWRARWRKGDISDARYELLLEDETIRCIKAQERYGLDVLVHGEFERNDMVEYFGEQLDGFVFSENGWVQSYGSRCVKPPIIFGDVLRPKPMTVRWFEFSQRQTKLPMKGMLTGPVTILQWSFVRDDISRSKVCQQIA
ncbi:MAG: 5-methyltetrahydropteroyltriglutamate--homocysteine S-methyltransferase, partial [Verrucomicrobiota bacterium]